ncbi:hypothetical protein A3J90_01670 [candidate division WOR-1 bacterium RIFOXYC2_FULL_37_10]|uniref:Ribosomal RNA small subunit methyltransferase E n=1 Tax=candidate division WOR-1 bacterium RIFOXYB2_FULL_37_13 TaxID=1802579 RepID=A0A1F4SPK1_UNCSA|nr:MAG: hypothetical protein A2246_02295 [candidate division WOR-1 bacterium RIFOXYA2_FULL_37_7]OGC22374.1 MAG: hypothetical protein A2310_01780 [candidate division WOR-1 bacterium RIFOXYB2_FULL_37_13]OGC35811.1 MAG: hypothetical protein A3J90_01670 [candidate division WOR-1 bacterium RIFOXYC2_FULL_37_10]
MHRFFVPHYQIEKDQIFIFGSDINHIVNVLRMTNGDKLEVFDSFANTYKAKIKEIQNNKIICSILKTSKDNKEAAVKVSLAQCLPKGKKMDLIIQKTTELGVFDIIPVESERSVPKIEDKADKKIEHWQKIAKEASEQSGRTIVPEIKPLIKFETLIKSCPKYDLKLIPWEGEQNNNLKKFICCREKFNPKGSDSNRCLLKSPPLLDNGILILIGPEGGFSQNEVESAKQNSFIPISLGKRILRTETAAIALLAQIFYEFE